MTNVALVTRQGTHQVLMTARDHAAGALVVRRPPVEDMFLPSGEALGCHRVEILMPTKKPRGQELTREQQRANQALHHRRLRIEHVNSSVKRCRIVKDRIRLWKAGVRDLVMELRCALHNFRVRLNPWQPMV